MPPGRRRGGRGLMKNPHKRDYSKRMPLEWTAPTPTDSVIPALFVSDKGPSPCMKTSTTVANCIPLWPAYKLDAGPVSLPLEVKNWRWLHIATREAWWSALAGTDAANFTETKALLKAAILSSRKKL